MALQLQFAALIGFAALMVLAALEDLRRLIIPNVLTLSLCLLWPFYLSGAPSLYAALGSLGCALIVFLAGALCFSRGYLGGGDVKLLAAATLWAGPEGTPALLVLTGVLGGMLALFLLMPPGAYLADAARAKLGPADAPAKSGLATPVPYGIAIAAAAMLVIVSPISVESAMRARTLILLLVALILAGGTTMMARVWLASQREARTEAPAPAPVASKSVLIVRSTAQRGQILRPDDLAWQQWPEGKIDKNYIQLGTRTPETYSGWVARQPIAAGEPLIEAKIIAPGNRGFLAAVLHPGMRAVSVPVTVTSGISGFVFPGDQVDLVVTYSVQERPQAGQATSGPQIDHKVSETIMRNVRVIAIDQRLDGKAGEAVVAKTATFEVTPKESEIVALASEMGKLSLSLRSLVPGPGEVRNEVSSPITGESNSPSLSPTPWTVTSARLRTAGGNPQPGSIDTGVTILRGGGQSATTSGASKPGG